MEDNVSKYHGKKVAAYVGEYSKPEDAVIVGHATQESVPEGMTFVDFLKIENVEEEIYLGRRQGEGWVEVIADPIAERPCTYGRSLIYELDIVP